MQRIPGRGKGKGLGRSKIPSLAENRRGPCISEEQTSLRIVHVCVVVCSVCMWVGNEEMGMWRVLCFVPLVISWTHPA
jgi:hypothetical protein